MKRKIIATLTVCAVFATSFLGIQTYYTTSYTADAAATQVAVSTPSVQSAEIFGGGYESTSAVTKQTATAIPLASSTTGSLQSSLESEAAERKNQDEKLSKSIGSINNTLLGYIGSRSTSNIGDGTLRGAIGNNSIAGIGTENNITSAINGLNTSIDGLNTSKQPKEDIGKYTGNIDTIGAGALPSTSSTCWVHASEAKGTFPKNSNYLMLETICSSATTQRATLYPDNKVYTRMYANGSWTAWSTTKDSFSGTKVYNITTQSSAELLTLRDVQEELGFDITSLADQVSISACNGDWNTSYTEIASICIQPETSNVAVLFNRNPNGYIRVNYTVSRID